MNRILKELTKLSAKERDRVKDILARLKTGSFKNLDIKKLKGRNDIFRARKGRIRIIYRKINSGSIFILAIERRSDKTYSNIY